MKDSRMGAFGTMGIVMLLILKWSLLFSLSSTDISYALLTFPVISRWIITIAIVYFPYIRSNGLGKAFRAGCDYSRSLFSTMLTIIIVYFIAGLQGLVAGLFALIIALMFLWYSIKQIGGLTGDIYGAVNEIGEVVVLSVFNILS